MTKQFDSKHFNTKVNICLPAKEEITDMDEREVKCDNCQRQVPSENYQMHLVHCKRNNSAVLFVWRGSVEKQREGALQGISRRN